VGSRGCGDAACWYTCDSYLDSEDTLDQSESRGARSPSTLEDLAADLTGGLEARQPRR
jgi:hypothetical protein